jgi:small subunit ribosomal protein S5
MDEQKTQTIDSVPEENVAPVDVAPIPVVDAKPTPSRGRFGGGRGGFRHGGGGRQGRGNRPSRPMEKQEFDSKPIDIARVSRVTKGGKRFSFRTTVVIGDGKGRVGIGIGKGRDVAQSIQKGTNQARKHLFTVPTINGTIPYQVEAKYCSARVILKPAKGGVKAGGPVRVVAKLSGITSLTGKLLGRTNNKLNIAMATLCALRMLKLKK